MTKETEERRVPIDRLIGDDWRWITFRQEEFFATCSQIKTTPYRRPPLI